MSFRPRADGGSIKPMLRRTRKRGERVSALSASLRWIILSDSGVGGAQELDVAGVVAVELDGHGERAALGQWVVPGVGLPVRRPGGGVHQDGAPRRAEDRRN